jgi:glycosyltransferase involved in cell wall biosynthesis
MVVIPNGIDCDRFKPDVSARRELRAEWRIADAELLFGLVGRIDPMKDHSTFLRAVAAMNAPARVRFVCVGSGSELLKAAMRTLASSLGVDRRVLWVGARDDMPRVYNALDVCVLSSAFGEGFPNAIAEAMATERPAIVTDVGDAKVLVGPTGLVVPPRDPTALARAMSSFAIAAPDELAEQGREARARVVARFSTERLVASTEAIFQSLIEKRPTGDANMLTNPPVNLYEH